MIRLHRSVYLIIIQVLVILGLESILLQGIHAWKASMTRSAVHQLSLVMSCVNEWKTSAGFQKKELVLPRKSKSPRLPPISTRGLAARSRPGLNAGPARVETANRTDVGSAPSSRSVPPLPTASVGYG